MNLKRYCNTYINILILKFNSGVNHATGMLIIVIMHEVNCNQCNYFKSTTSIVINFMLNHDFDKWWAFSFVTCFIGFRGILWIFYLHSTYWIMYSLWFYWSKFLKIVTKWFGFTINIYCVMLFLFFRLPKQGRCNLYR